MRLAKANLQNLDTVFLNKLKEQNPNGYQDALRAVVDDSGVFTPRQSLAASEEVFENAVDGERKPVQDILRSLAGRQVSYPGDIAMDWGAINSATPRKVLKGKYQAEIDIHPAEVTVGAPRMRVKNVDEWVNDPAAQAFVDPSSVGLDISDPKILRAVAMGEASSRGDRAGVLAANKRYDFTDEEVQEFMAGAKIGGEGFASSIRNQGLQGREQELIDPATGQLLSSMPAAYQKQFYDDRNLQLGRNWLESGGTGFNDPGSAIAIPNNNYQMEHDYAFSGTNSSGRAEIPENRPGFYERYVNSEKNDIDPTDYYQMQRLAYLAKQQGIDITGVMKSNNAKDALGAMIARANPTVVVGDRRRKDNSIAEYPERALQNNTLIERAMEPQKRFASKPAVEEAARQTFGSDRDGSPGTNRNRDRALFIEAGGDVTIGPGVLRSNGKNGNGNGKH